MQRPLLEFPSETGRTAASGVRLVNAEGNLSVHRKLPRLQKALMTYLNSPFPAIIRLSWSRVIVLVLILYFVTIGIFAVWLNAVDRGIQCVTNATTFADHFFFCCQCVLGLSFGYLSPICYSSNLLTTLMATVGTLEHTAVTGCVFAKFTLSRRRDLAVKFSSRIVGTKEKESLVALSFRFVNVLHKHVFKVKMQLHLIEHRPEVPPLIEEIKIFATSIPQEFMALPVEVVAYVKKDRLFNFLQVGTSNAGPYSPVNRQWLVFDRSGAAGGDSAIDDSQHDRRPVENASFEMVCSLRFYDSTTGTAICARKSWKLDAVEWRSRGSWAWRNVVSVTDSEIDVAINSLDDITEFPVYSQDLDAYALPRRVQSAEHFRL